jgi:hypothetical protein
MEAMLGISLYSYLYLNWQKGYIFLITAYVFNKIGEKDTSRFCLEVMEVGGETEGVGGRKEKWPKQCMHI